MLVAIAIPVYGQVVRNAANRAHASNCRILIGAAQMLIAEIGLPAGGNDWVIHHDNFGDDVTGSDGEEALAAFLEDWPTIPDRANENPDIGDLPEDWPETQPVNYQVTVDADTGNITLQLLGGTTT